jgi:hypothetical protein
VSQRAERLDATVKVCFAEVTRSGMTSPGCPFCDVVTLLIHAMIVYCIQMPSQLDSDGGAL